MILTRLIRKFKHVLFIPKGITQKPLSTRAVISDLFPLRDDSDWQTFFELLNVPGIIAGDNAQKRKTNARFIFFSKTGEVVGERVVEVGNLGRQTTLLDSDFFGGINKARSFSVFHEDLPTELDIGQSYLAERGYSGYLRKGSAIRGYVHGNLDAIASSQGGRLESLGNQGILPRVYQVQHPLRGPATYEFFLPNPCKRRVSVQVQHRGESGKWLNMLRFRLNPRGSEIFLVEKVDDFPTFIRIKSRLYLGRPVVFRVAGDGIDVFHG